MLGGVLEEILREVMEDLLIEAQLKEVQLEESQLKEVQLEEVPNGVLNEVQEDVPEVA